VTEVLDAVTPEKPADLSDKSLNGLDLSRLELSNVDQEG
jgi:hypothetical protein